MNWKFYKYKRHKIGLSWPLMISSENIGYFVNESGIMQRDEYGCTLSYLRKNPHFLNNDYTEVSLPEALNIIESNKEKVLDVLKITLQKQSLTKEIKSQIISKLEQKRAFDADSATLLDEDFFTLQKMVKNKSIKMNKNGKFYIEKKS